MIVNDFPTNAEYFRAICGFPNYEISTDGRVRIIKTGKIMKLKLKAVDISKLDFTKIKKDHFIVSIGWFQLPSVIKKIIVM